MYLRFFKRQAEEEKSTTQRKVANPEENTYKMFLLIKASRLPLGSSYIFIGGEVRRGEESSSSK